MNIKTLNFSIVLNVLTKLGILAAAIFGYLLPSILFASSDWQTVTPSGATVFNTIKSAGDYVVLGTSSGVYVSSNNGQNWTQYVSGSNVLSVAIGLIVDQDTFTYTATSGTPVILGTSAGIYRGTLGGSSWTAASTGPTGAVNDLEFDQAQAVAGTRAQIYAATPQGVYRSDNLGVNWTLRNTGMTTGGNRQASKIVTNYGDSSIYVVSNITAATSTGEVYSSLMYAENSNTNESWTLAKSADSTLKDISVVNAAGPVTWLSKTNGIYESDGTNNWSDVSGDLASVSVRTVDSDYLDATLAYAGTANGVWRTTNQALSSPQWLSIQGSLVDTDISFVNTNPASSTLIYALGASGVYKLSLLNSTEDLTAPATVSDLSVSQDATNFQLLWTAPGDDSTYGTANNYEVRYSTAGTIDDSNWDTVTSASCPAPQVAGSPETCFISKPSSEILTYYFAVKAVDEVGNKSAVSNVYSTLMQDTSAPTISAVASSTSAVIATITWNTNENTDAQVNYGLTSSYTASSSLDSVLNNTHTVTLTGLTNDTTYHFRVRSSDSSLNRTVSSDYTFKTIVSDLTAPIISAVSSSVTSSSITVTWTTNELATSQVDTGLNSSYAGQSTTDSNITTSHSVTVGGLSDGTNYFYRIRSDDSSGNTAYSTGSFTTTVAPIVITPVTTVPRGGGGGGGGKGGYIRPLTTITAGTNPASVSSSAGPSLRSLVELLIAVGVIAPDKIQMARSFLNTLPASTQTTGYTAPSPTIGFKNITKPLSLGFDDPEVITLQRILNKHGYPIAAFGKGSLGNEISYFGYGTDTALKKFQCAYKIACAGQYGYGFVGPKTRAILVGLGY